MSVASQHRDETVHLAVKAVLTGEVPISKLAQDLGIGVATIRRWVRDAIDQSPYHESFDHLAEEVVRLRRENAELRKLVQGRKPRTPANPPPGTVKPQPLYVTRRAGPALLPHAVAAE